MKSFKPHMMYKGSKAVKANKVEDHNRLKKEGYTHEAPKAKQGFKIKYKAGGKSKVNEAENYTKPSMRKRLFQSILAGTSGGNAGQWSARKAQLLAKRYKEKGGGYTS